MGNIALETEGIPKRIGRRLESNMLDNFKMTEGETTTETPTTGAEPVDEEVLNRFEDMFNARFTDADEMFQEYVANKGGRVPPILNHYQVMRPRNQRGGYGRGFYNNRRGMKRSYDGGDWYGNDGKQRWHQENYNRQGWGGGGYNRGGYGGGYGNQGGYGYNQGYGNQGYGRGGYGGGGGGGYRGRGGYGGGYRGGYQGQGGYQQQDRWGGNRGGGRFQRGGGQQRKWEDY